MKPSHGWMIWGALALCAAIVLGAMSWLTRSVLDSERDRSEAEARADLEERTRLALWRMDAEGAAILLAENSLPSRGYGTVPADPDSVVRLRFESRDQGGLVSASDPGEVTLMQAHFAENPLPVEQSELLRCALAHSESAWQALPKDAPADKSRNLDLRQKEGPVQARAAVGYQTGFNNAEKAQRTKVVDQTANNFIPQQLPLPETLQLETGSMRALWIGDELFLLRQLTAPGPAPLIAGVQGAWIDGGKLRARLLEEVGDLLPNATLEALAGTPDFVEAAAQDPMSLVSFPFRLHRNEGLPAHTARISDLLRVGWIAVIVALAAVALLVRGIMRLSERRASFVSAVTHELRTPLTTFQLYSDMLQSGAVKEEKRGEYFLTLHREAGRLSHLVENVLAFSGIERGSARAAPASLTAKELVLPMLERFEDRLHEAGLKLAVDFDDPVWQSVVRADPAAVEHVLFNLIDNAAKYAAGSSPAVVELEVEATGSALAIKVRDHGPGITPAERKRVFRAFHKSAAAAAETRPGVGLGLALSRRLARAGGGDLTFCGDDDGSCFALTLPMPRS